MNHWELFIDGAARNNPGPAGAGVYLLKDKECFLKKGYYLGTLTNNQAEYNALLIGLELTIKNMMVNDTLVIYSDSLLLVKQIQGDYKVKHENLIPLYIKAKKILSLLKFDIKHVLRDKNKVADSMANYGIDHKIDINDECK